MSYIDWVSWIDNKFSKSMIKDIVKNELVGCKQDWVGK